MAVGLGELRPAERRLPISEARRIRNERNSRVLTEAESEAAVREGISRFQEEYLGWGAEQIRIHFIGDFVIVRMRDVLTVAERQLAKSSSPETGRELIKRIRKQLVELARPMLDSIP